jgi:hypothetical protein
MRPLRSESGILGGSEFIAFLRHRGKQLLNVAQLSIELLNPLPQWLLDRVVKDSRLGDQGVWCRWFRSFWSRWLPS